MSRGDAGRAEARRRFGTPEPDPSTTNQPAPGEWTLMDLHEPGARGRAHAAARRGDASAARALRDADKAYAELGRQHGGG